MKLLLLAFATILLFLTTSINAASLKNLSEKLSADAVNDNTKEKLPNEEIMLGDESGNSNSNNREQNDEEVSELDELKGHKEEKIHNNEAINFTEQLEDSLKKLHKSHHKAHDDSNNKSKSFKDAFESTTNEQKQKEIFKSLPPDASEVSSSGNNNNKINANNIKSIRRSSLRNEVNAELALSPATMLRHVNGKYSAYDMAQYIFWTGDEEGVAKAVEELIDEGLMSRENAIEFLNDIRLGIDYLENMYSLKQSSESKNARASVKQQATTQESSAIEDMPFSYSYNYQKFHSFFKPSNKEKVNFEEDETPTLSPIAIKTLEKIPSLIKLTEAHHKGTNKQQESTSFEGADDTGRSRLADFLFGEYSLEEVIYQLAKTMFTQSLTHGSEESQAALQKLTQFLENEGNHGRISPALQKKILDVLLAALSDTLNENPEVMEKARLALTTK